MIDQHLTVNDVLRRHPDTLAVLNRFGVDACCGGGDTLAEAAEREGIELAQLLQELRRAMAEEVR